MYILYGRKRFHLPVKQFSTNLVYALTKGYNKTKSKIVFYKNSYLFIRIKRHLRNNKS